jgi:two-component system sensor histidine kinase ChiS
VGFLINILVDQINKERISLGKEKISIGIGIHTKSTIIGTVGALEQMEGTVISDVVNLASRLEGLTKVLGAQVLISEAIFDSLTQEKKYDSRYLGEMEVKGKAGTTKVWEILTGEDENTKWKIYSKEKMEEAV